MTYNDTKTRMCDLYKSHDDLSRHANVISWWQYSMYTYENSVVFSNMYSTPFVPNEYHFIKIRNNLILKFPSYP